MINEAKTMLYEKLWIDDNQNNNSSFENFEKWIVDELMLNNYDLAIQAWETNWKIILDWLSQLASWEWLKQVTEAIWENFWSLLTWNAYEKWKSVAELWLIWSWVGTGIYVWKKTLKLWMKQISKLRVNKERLVQSPEIKTAVWETNSKVSEIIPKKEFDFESKLADNLPEEQLKELKKLKNKEFLDNRLDLKDFDNLSVDEKLKSLWIPKEFYDLINESWLWWKWFDVIKRYRALQYRDELLWKEYIDFNSMIDKVISKTPSLDRTEAMLIFAFTDKFMFQNINSLLRWDKKITKVQEKLLNKLDEWIVKMPDLEWKHIIRWDSHYSWISKNEIIRDWNILNNVKIKELINDWGTIWLIKWDNISLDAYTFVSNNKNDIFIWKDFSKNDTLIIIKWTEWVVKDISSLSMHKNFWERLLERNTDFEWIIKRWTDLEFIDSRIIKNAKLNDWEFIKKILIVRVKK